MLYTKPGLGLQWSKQELLSLVGRNYKRKALKHKRLRAAAFDEFSALPGLLVWFKQIRSKGVFLSGMLMREKLSALLSRIVACMIICQSLTALCCFKRCCDILKLKIMRGWQFSHRGSHGLSTNFKYLRDNVSFNSTVIIVFWVLLGFFLGKWDHKLSAIVYKSYMIEWQALQMFGTVD